MPKLMSNIRNESDDLDTMLTERGKRYGDFADHARVTQDILRALFAEAPQLTNVHREALHMIAHKLGRIVCGDPDYVDSWHDIAGYARLVEKHLTGRQAGTTAAGHSPQA